MTKQQRKAKLEIADALVSLVRQYHNMVQRDAQGDNGYDVEQKKIELADAFLKWQHG